MELMLIDGNSIVNRAYYGIRALNAPDGTPTNAVYGFLTIFRRLYEDYKPDAVCVAFDLKDPTFRHRACDYYKAQRKPMDEALAVQIPILKEVLDNMGIKRCELSGYEADDILGTLSARCEEQGWTSMVVTGDKDSLQLISSSTTVCNVKSRMGQTETILYTPERFFEEYGFEPRKMVDLKALMGDSSDNIPGVPGIGEKSAMELVRSYGGVDEIYAHLPELPIKEGQRKKLTEGEHSARESYWLATIFRQVPIEFELESAVWHEDYKEGLYEQFKRLGFNKFIEKWQISEAVAVETAKDADNDTHVQIERIDGDFDSLDLALERAEYISVYLPEGSLDSLEICDGKKLYGVSWSMDGDRYTSLLKKVFSADVKKISHNVKDLMGALLGEGLTVEGFIFDTALAAYLLNATDSDYSLPRLSMRYLDRDMNGAQAVFELYEPLKQKLTELNMDELYYKIELPLCRVLCDMERQGFLIDRKALYEYGENLNARIAQSQKKVWDYAGHEFNINSPRQLGEVLFDELYLPAGKKTKTGWSTNADVLEKLRGKHPIVDEVLEFRTLSKLKSTYSDGLLKVIGSDGRIHTSFQMTVTATGRLSSVEPNLQNIPIRRELGAQIRKMFVPAPGNVLVDADYSQIELRLLAHISDDKAMQEAFLSGEDFHKVTASKVFNIPLEEVTSAERGRAKAVNFGIVYGISAFALSQDIGVTPSQAQAYMDAYMEKYHGVRDYMKNIVEKAKKDGFVCTIYGRRRELPELKDKKFTVRSFGERVALNMPIQGTAADIIKLAMVNVYERLSAEGLKAKLILQVHDELIVECPEAEQEKVKAILTQEMEGVAKLSVPLLVEAKSGHNWAEAH